MFSMGCGFLAYKKLPSCSSWVDYWWETLPK
jgi:hypothetical protein